jgi:hypothetical protein
MDDCNDENDEIDDCNDEYDDETIVLMQIWFGMHRHF